MAKRSSYQKMTKDDLRASRVLTLAVKFFGSDKPIPTSDIYSDLYPDLDTKSFNRQFLRDRDLLANLGLVIRAVGDNPETMWGVDEDASYMQGEALSADDARMLYVLCYDMAFDQAFPYRDELRIALAKISRMCRGTAVALDDRTPAPEHKLLSALVSCMSNRHLAEVTYTDAQGSTSTRTIALLGSFGLRENTYFVASRANADGSLVPDSLRNYRLDRFSQVKELPKTSYQIPLDFSVRDFERLPFQIGDPCGKALFHVPADVDSQVRHAMELHGKVEPNDGEADGSVTWKVSYSNVRDAASWAVGLGVVPMGPQELMDAYHEVLRAALAPAYDPSLKGDMDPTSTTASPRATGRTGSIAVTRQLMALATSLTEEGEVITAEDVAASLGVDFDTARHLIMLVSMSSGESIDYLPVVLSDESDEVSLMEGARMSARRVRLTRAETIALQAALTELGVAQDDPLVQTLVSSYASPRVSLDDIRRTLEIPSSASDLDVLRRCSQAIAERHGLSFSYQPITGGTPSRRRVLPRMVTRGDDSWYLRAYDLVRQAERIFRIDRMSDLESFEPKSLGGIGSSDSTEATRLVTVLFGDPHYLDLFYWEGLQVLARDETGVLTRMPYYGGMWLPRHLAACAGTVRVDNEELAKRIRQVCGRQPI